MLGNIERNGESCGKKLSEKSSTNSRITIGSLSGSISLSFDGENENDFQLPESVEPEATMPEAQETTAIENSESASSDPTVQS
jgi:hypothetical protein